MVTAVVIVRNTKSNLGVSAAESRTAIMMISAVKMPKKKKE